MEKIVALVISLIFCSDLLSQNLIQNHSFEQYNYIPQNWVSSHSEFNSSIKYWSSPNSGSPDIIFDKSHKYFDNRPYIDLNNYKASDGRFFIGIRMYGCKSQYSICREYVQNELKEPLEQMTEYELSCMIRPTTQSLKINNIGFALSEEGIKSYESLLLKNVDIIYETDSIISDTTDWHKLVTRFKPTSSNYKYILIGNFKNDSNTKTMQSRSNKAYYLIDNVKLERIRSIDQKLILKYETNQWLVSNSQLKRLENFIRTVRNINDKKVIITGYASQEGERNNNIELSMKRATEVYHHLSKQIDAEYEVSWKGEVEKFGTQEENRIVIIEVQKKEL